MVQELTAAGRVAAVVLGLAAGGFGVASAQAEPDATDAVGLERYEIDVAHSSVDFVVRHLGVTNVRGRFGRFGGHVELDAGDVTRSRVEVTIDAASVDTQNERRDNHLRSDDFFEVEAYPSLSFLGRRVERAGDGLVLVGDLTIRGVTREVRIPFELTGPVQIGANRKRVGAEGALVINRFDYGLRWNRFTEAVQVVADAVRIELSISAVSRTDG
jgi:polyisoprenoid-binding protein YceI